LASFQPPLGSATCLEVPDLLLQQTKEKLVSEGQELVVHGIGDLASIRGCVSQDNWVVTICSHHTI